MGVPDPNSEGVPFATEAEATEWLRAHGIEHVTRLSLWALAPRVEPPFLPQLRSMSYRRRAIELISEDTLARWARETMPSPRLKQELPGVAWSFVSYERAYRDQALRELPERLAAPADERTHAVHRLLLELRAQFPSSVAPRPASWFAGDASQVDIKLPGFHHREARCSEVPHGATAGFLLPETRLVFSPDAVRARCNCGAAFCVHGLGLVDAALLWLRQPWSDGFGEALAELVRPSWDRTLRALEVALEENPRELAGFELSWRLEPIEDYGVEVRPYVHRRNKKGQRSAGSKVSRRKLLAEYGSALSADDARLAALLPEGELPVSREALFELVGRTDLTLEGPQALPVQVDRAKVGLVAEDRNGTVFVSPGIDGTALPAPLVDRLRRERPEHPHWIWDAGVRRLTVLDIGPELLKVLDVLAFHENAFPPESHGALLERLSKLSLRLPVAMPRSVMGEAVAPQQLPVVRLEAQSGGAVRVELRVRALPDGPAFFPGEGARDVHVRRGTNAVHAVRDFVKEKRAVEELQALLPLDAAEPEEAPFTFRFSSAQGGLAILAACAGIELKPEVEWTSAPMRLAARGGPGALKVVLEKKRDWFGALGGLAVEGERVELARLLDAVRRKERFVQVNASTYVEIEQALRAHLERLADHTFSARHGLELGPAAAESIAGLERAGAEVDAHQSWQAMVERIFAAKELNPRVPRGLKTELRDYQHEGFRWLTRLSSWGAGGVLADDMGLGKTIQALAVLLERSKLGPALVLAPTSVAFNWIDEAKKFAPGLRFHLYADSEDRGRTLERLGPKDVLVISYGLLTRDLERLSAIRFATIVFDEAQSLKNAMTHRFRAARALQGDFKFALSGTPLENHLGELWSLFAIVFPTLLGSWEAFRSKFANPIEKGLDPTAAPALARVLQPFLLRRTKAQVETQLPPRTDVRVPVVLSPPEWTLYEDARLAALSDLETRKSVLREQERRVEILAALTRLRLLASHPRLYDAESKLESSKLERFMELVDELRAEGQRTLVFSQFTSHLALVREVLDARGIAYEYLDGSTPQGARAERVRAFQEGDAPLFLISLKAGGFGLNLTAATSVIHLDPWWNPAVEDQASDRAHRIGQQRPVTVYRLVARGTIEETMLGLHEYKRSLVAGVLEGKDAAAKLSSQELLGLLAQRSAPVDEPEAADAKH